MGWGRSQRAALAYLLVSACAFGGESNDAAIGDTGPDTGRPDAAGRDADSPDADSPDAESNDAEVEDAGSPDVPPSGPRLEVGTGSFEFEPLTAGQIVELISGPQGGGRFEGFHIWFGARTWELNPTAISVTFIVMLASDRTELARLNWVTNFRATATDAYEIWGGNPRLMDCCAAVDQPLIMRVEVLDADGLSAAGETEVVGESECADLTMSYCP